MHAQSRDVYLAALRFVNRSASTDLSGMVGTFLGIWMGYGFVGPASIALEHTAKYELKAYECVKSAIVATVAGQAPQMAIEFGRKALPTEKRPGFQELNDHVRS